MTLPTIAVIGGTGDLGFGLALRWARGGVPVVIGSREEKKAKDGAERLKELLSGQSPSTVEGLENAQAAAKASVVVVTVPFTAQAAILKSIRASLKNCIIVDT